MNTPTRQSRIRSVVLLLLLLALFFYAFTATPAKWLHVSSAVNNRIFRQRAAGWEQLPDTPANPAQLLVSPSGAVWVREFTTKISRLENGAWTTSSPSHFGARAAWSPGAFALDGEKVWVGTADALALWDGARWTSHYEAARHGTPSSIVAGGGRVWTINQYGDLSVFENGQWSAQDAKFPAPVVENHPPALALSSDGALWLVADGVWRLQESQWTPVRPGGRELHNIDLLGATGDGVWLWDGDQLLRLSSDATAIAYTRSEMGLSSQNWLRTAVSAAGSIWFATSDGILEFDGHVWRNIPPPVAGVKWILTARVAPDGALWVLGSTPNPNFNRSLYLIYAFPLVLLIAAVLRPVLLSLWWKRRRRVELPHPEQEIALNASWNAFMTVLVVILGALLGFRILKSLWPAAPAWTYLAIALALHVIMMFWEPRSTGGSSRLIWSRTLQVLPGSLCIFILLSWHTVSKVYHGSVIWVFALLLLAIVYLPAVTYFVNDAIRRGDYDGALRTIHRAWFFNPDSPQALMGRGEVLKLAARYAEAEQVLLRAAERLGNSFDQARVLESLGDVLLELQRYDDAERCFESAVRVSGLPHARPQTIVGRSKPGRSPNSAVLPKPKRLP